MELVSDLRISGVVQGIGRTEGALYRAASDDDFALAVRRLSAFVMERAEVTAARVGFGWLGGATAPSTYPQLRGEFEVSRASGAPLKVSNLFCDQSIYSRASVNVAFRFWHDVHHVSLGLSFELPDELDLALWHLQEARTAGLHPTSLAYALLEADTLGQLLLMGLAGRFPFDQRAFVGTCVRDGLAEGLALEIRRLPPPALSGAA